MTKEDYIISIIGIQTINGQSEKTEFTTTGKYKNSGKNKVIEYREYDNSAVKYGSIASLNVCDGKIVTLTRDDVDEASMVLEKGKRHLCNYNTMIGSITLGVFTNKLTSSLGDDGGTLDVEYSLDLNCDISSEHKLTVNVRKKTEDIDNDVKTSVNT